jgi:hypothetical protein
MPQLTPAGVDALRASLRPEYANLPVEEVAALVDPVLTQLPRSTADDFWQSLNSIGRAAAPVLERAAPAMAQGAASGAPLGPWGALIGAGAGLASSALGPQARPPAAPPPQPAPPPPPRPPTVPVAAPSPPAATPTPVAAPTPIPLPSGPGAAAAFLSLADNPIIKAAMLSQLAPDAGRPDVTAPSGANLPRGAINNLLMQLLANATEALPEAESITEQEYLRGETGEFLIDPASPEQQAALVLAHLQQPRQESVEAAYDGEAIFGEFAEVDVTEWIDADDLGDAVRFY